MVALCGTVTTCCSRTMSESCGDKTTVGLFPFPSRLQIFPQIHIPHQPVQIIWVQVEELRGFSEITAGLSDSLDDHLPFDAIYGFVVPEIARPRRVSG